MPDLGPMIQILLNSIAGGTLIALVAVGFNLVFNTTKVFHMAHGALYILGASACQFFLGVFGMGGNFGLLLAGLCGIFTAVLTGCLVERLAYFPLYKSHARETIALITSLGVYFFIVHSIAILRNGDTPIALTDREVSILPIGAGRLTDIQAVQIGIGLLTLGALFFFSRSRFYLKIRAVSDNPVVAQKFGIPLTQYRLLAIAIGSALAAESAALRAAEVGIDPHSGLQVTLIASVAVIVGGTRSLAGTVVVSFLLALIQNTTDSFQSAIWKEILTYLLLLATLLFFREGLLTSKTRIEEQS